MTRESIRNKLMSADDIYMLAGMIEDLVKDFEDHHMNEDHGEYGPSIPTDMMDPELANQEMLEGIEEFMNMVR